MKMPLTAAQNLEIRPLSAGFSLGTSFIERNLIPNIKVSIKPTILLPWSHFVSFLFKHESLALILVICVIIIGIAIAALSLLKHPASFGLAFVPIFSGIIGLMLLVFPLTNKETGQYWIREISESLDQFQDKKILEIQNQLNFHEQSFKELDLQHSPLKK